MKEINQKKGKREKERHGDITERSKEGV